MSKKTRDVLLIVAMVAINVSVAFYAGYRFGYDDAMYECAEIILGH